MSEKIVGQIVEVEGKEGLFLVVDYKNNERVGDCSYDREFWLYPYDSSLSDDVDININETVKYELQGTKNTVRIREDKKEYKQYGHSLIRDVKKVMFERIWEEVVTPTR
ncbi:hypothetical protein CON36_36445 [Bacillus cereus]|uniref:Uncharacterized protein n=1 Tax=Bacillus cereus TaxID=1396 RepID=A0A9X6SS07_BACCE|nr:hypothetical protein [Bacillus cereus]PDZ93954.1 hypothetical protein CON36_36445 [Bacillus cereus]